MQKRPRRQLKVLAEGFKSDFSDWLRYENLAELKDGERGTGGRYQYKDRRTGMCYIHDFKEALNLENYKSFKNKYERRIKRLYTYIDKSKDILFVYDTRWKDVKPKDFKELQAVLSNKFSGKKFSFLIFNFCSEDNNAYNFENGLIISASKMPDEYDYTQYRDFKWAFLDGLRLSDGYVKSDADIPLAAVILPSIFVFVIKILSNIIPNKRFRKIFRRGMYVAAEKIK